MKHFHKLATAAVALSMVVGGFVQPAFALGTNTDPNSILNPGDLGLQQINQSAGLGSNSIYQTVGKFIQLALTLVGVIAIILVIFGGFKWMTAGGSEEKVEEAKKVLYSGAIGVVIIFSAYALTTFIIGALIKSTGATGFSGY